MENLMCERNSKEKKNMNKKRKEKNECGCQHGDDIMQKYSLKEMN